MYTIEDIETGETGLNCQGIWNRERMERANELSNHLFLPQIKPYFWNHHVRNLSYKCYISWYEGKESKEVV